MPNFLVIAKVYGVTSYKIKTLNEIQNLLETNDLSLKPILFDVNVIENENCYSTITPIRSNSQMLGLEK